MQVSCRIRNQALPRFTYLRHLSLRFHFYVQFVQKVQHHDLPLKLITVELCIGCDRVSKQKKDDLVNNNFSIKSFQGCHGEIWPRDQIMLKGEVYPELFNFSNPANFH
jgi:hypothetical protein